MVQSGPYSQPPIYCPNGHIIDITATAGGRAHHQSASCDSGPWCAPKGATRPFEPACLPVIISGSSWGFVCNYPVSSSGMNEEAHASCCSNHLKFKRNIWLPTSSLAAYKRWNSTATLKVFTGLLLMEKCSHFNASSLDASLKIMLMWVWLLWVYCCL